MKEGRSRQIMKRGLALLICSLLVIPLVSASEGGVNKEMDLTDTPIASISTPPVISSGAEFEIAVTLEQAAVDNGTTVSWDWQVCLNSGVCLAPVPVNMTSGDDGFTWTTSMTPVEEQSYINYRISLHWQDGNKTSYPSSGFGGKVWSDCWVAGEDSGGDACPESNDDSSGFSDGLPGFTLPLVFASLSLMALAVGRKQA